MVELYREQGSFQKAEDALGRYTEDHFSVTKEVLAEQITERVSAPVRYRM